MRNPLCYIVGPHPLDTACRMRPFPVYIACSVVYVCWAHEYVSCAKTDEPTDVSFGEQTRVGSIFHARCTFEGKCAGSS